MASVVLQQLQLRDDHDMRRQQLQQRLRTYHVRLVPADHSVRVSGRRDVFLLLVRRRRALAQYQGARSSDAAQR